MADYIPELAAVDPDQYGLAVAMHAGHVYEVGDSQVEFTIQSISKPLTYALVLSRLGYPAVDDRIGVEPSGDAFNEISVDDRRRPKNPMINAGAITAASLLLPQRREISAAEIDAAFEDLLEFYSACAGRQLEVDERVLASEIETGSRNRAIAYMLDSFGRMTTDPDAALQLYYRQCSLKVTCEDLAIIGSTVANGGNNPRTGRQVFTQEVAQRLLGVMTTCGMYDGAGDWVISVGMPAKSGVGGGILAVLPGQLGIGVFSPRLDAHGNSVRGVATCRHLSADLGLHMFNFMRDARVTLRSVYDLRGHPVDETLPPFTRQRLRAARNRIRVFELQGDLTFAGVETAVRRMEEEMGDLDVIIVDISRVSSIDPVARTVLLMANRRLRAEGRLGVMIDPDRVVRDSVDRHQDDVLAPNIGAPSDLRGVNPDLPHIHGGFDTAIAEAERFQLEKSGETTALGSPPEGG